MKKNIAVIMGGDCPERDISIITAVQAMKNLDKSAYKIYPIVLCGGKFFFSEDFVNLKAFQGGIKGGQEAVFSGSVLSVKTGLFSKFKRLARIDCALLCTHGGSGEDGSMQGYFEAIGLPYTGPGVAASALCMDKILSKQAYEYMGLAYVEYSIGTPDEIESQLGYPLIVKPANLGSSIGISACENYEELLDAMSVAGEFCSRVLVEKKLTNFTELNCAAATIDGEIVLSAIEKPAVWQDFLSFDDKYINCGEKKRELPAQITEELARRIRELTFDIYTRLGLSGIVRMDFLADESGEVYINEVNTIPGSLAFYLFEEAGIPFKRLLSKTIKTAILRTEEAGKYKRYYTSDVLKKFSGNAKGKGKI